MELKPCPFCGGSPVMGICYNAKNNKCHRIVYCRDCEAQSAKVLEHGDARDENSLAAQLAAQAWNRRVKNAQN